VRRGGIRDEDGKKIEGKGKKEGEEAGEYELGDGKTSQYET
jgi:hypothetical protein